MQAGQICGQSWFQSRGEGAERLHLVFIALPAGGRSGDKFDTGATAPKAPAATGTEARAPQACTQAVPSTGGEGVATAPTKTQVSTSNAAATAIATGNGGGDHSCRKRRGVVRIKVRREDTWGVRACVLKSVAWGQGGLVRRLFASFDSFCLCVETLVLCLSLPRPARYHRRFPVWMAS